MTPITTLALAARLMGASGIVLAVAACSGFGLTPPAEPSSALDCVDDSAACIERRQVALKSMIADRDRSWVRQPATPHAYATGVRLFAFKGRKKDLSCEELAIGRREAENANIVLRSPAASELSPAQVSRSALLAAEVSKELSLEMRRRCRT